MKIISKLTKRNILMFVRNKTSVFFSFLAVIIILGLYILFLSDLQVKDIENSLGHVAGIKALVNSWVMAGLIAISTVTIALGSLGRIVADRENKTITDFLVSPIKRSYIFISYILATLVITFIMSIILFTIAELYILSSGGVLLSISQIFEVLGIIIMCVISSSLLVLLAVSFLKSLHSFSIMSNLVGTMIGFVTGAYVPMGSLPKGIQTFANLIPVSQGASLLRKIFLDAPSKAVFHSNVTALKDYNQAMGVDLYINNHALSSHFMIIYILGSIVLLCVLNTIRFRKMKNI